jgi:hypothetical protein
MKQGTKVESGKKSAGRKRRGSSTKVKGDMGKHGMEAMTLGPVVRLARMEEKLIDLRKLLLAQQQQRADEIRKYNQWKMERMQEIALSDKQIHTLYSIISADLKLLFSHTKTSPELVKTLTDIQRALADLAIEQMSQISSRITSGQNVFLPTMIKSLDELKNNPWIDFMSGANRILRNAASKQSTLLHNDVFQGLLEKTEELHKDALLKSSHRKHLKGSALKRGSELRH